MEPEQAGLSFEQVLGILRRRAPWALLCFVIVTGVAYGYSKHETKKYTATAAVTFNSNPLSQEVLGLSPTSNSNLVAQQDSNLELVKLGDTAAETAALLGHGLTSEGVSKSVSVGVKGETNIVAVSATSTSPALAASIANTYTRQFVTEQQDANRRLFKSALTLVNRQLAKLPPAQRSASAGLDLEERAHTLGLLTELGYNNAEVAGEARVPTSPSSPKTKRNTLLGALLGLVTALALAFVLERLDRRIRTPDEFVAIYRAPLLGVIPKSKALARSGRGRGGQIALPEVEAEAFSLAWAHLQAFNADSDPHSVVIASAEVGDGKTIVSRYLAEAAARLGSRVLLIEADLRRPTLAQQLGFDARRGLADVLAGDVAIGDAIQSVELSARGNRKAQRTLSVLPAGASLPPNPGGSLETRAMQTALEWARWSGYELVVIDTPPLLAVSDAFPMLAKVDGVVLVGRVGHSRDDGADRLQQVLAGSGARLLGVIVNSANSGIPEPYATVGKQATGLDPSDEFVSTASPPGGTETT